LFIDRGTYLYRPDWHISVANVRSAIHYTPLNKAPGLDCVTNEVLRCLGLDACTHLTRIFNELLADPRKIPPAWKRSFVALIAKCDNPGRTDYRPITLLSAVAKLLERVVLTKLERWCAKADKFPLNESQAGFVRGRGTYEQMWQMLVASDRASIAGERSDILFLDLKKAFDSAPITRVFRRMRAKGVPMYICCFVYHWLTGHKRRLMVGEYQVENDAMWIEVKRGVAQGSVLSPMCFNFLVDELYDDIDEYNRQEGGGATMTFGYADDTAVQIVRISDSQTDSSIRAQQIGDICSAFSSRNGFEWNAAKSAVMARKWRGGRATKMKNAVTLTNDGVDSAISFSKKYVYLGMEVRPEDLEEYWDDERAARLVSNARSVSYVV
jgi:hypothetical protein